MLKREFLNVVQEIQLELKAFRNKLPVECQFSQTNLWLSTYTLSRITWLIMHLWWHQTHCDLYRFTATELARLPQDYSTACWAKCLTHALSVFCILETGNQAGVRIISPWVG